MDVQLRRLGPFPQVKALPLTDKDAVWKAGRGSDSDIFIISRFASRTHFSIIHRQKKFYIFDHGSSNGTFVNDEKIISQKEHPLPLNSIISVGMLSVHQNEPDCIVLAFELRKEKETESTSALTGVEPQEAVNTTTKIDTTTTSAFNTNDRSKIITTTSNSTTITTSIATTTNVKEKVDSQIKSVSDKLTKELGLKAVQGEHSFQSSTSDVELKATNNAHAPEENEVVELYSSSPAGKETSVSAVKSKRIYELITIDDSPDDQGESITNSAAITTTTITTATATANINTTTTITTVTATANINTTTTTTTATATANINTTTTTNTSATDTIKENLSCDDGLAQSGTYSIKADMDLFDPEGFADDEIIEAFEALTQVDEPETTNSQMSYSVTEDFIEISDTEENVNNTAPQIGNADFIKLEPQDAEEYDDDVICLDVIESNNNENRQPITEIKIEDDEVYTETDMKWMGKLFKTKEECCSFIQSQRESTGSQESDDVDNGWIELVANCANQIEQILLAEQNLNGETLFFRKDQRSNDLGNEEIVTSVVTETNDGSATAGLKRDVIPEKTTVREELQDSLSKVKKRPRNVSSKTKTSITPKTLELIDPYELDDDEFVAKHVKKKSKLDANSSETYKKLQTNEKSALSNSIHASGLKVSEKVKSKVENLSATERKKIKDQRKRRLRELSSREPQKEETNNTAPRRLPPLKIKITRKNRTEYLCHEMTSDNQSDSTDRNISGQKEKPTGRLGHLTKKVESSVRDKVANVPSAKFPSQKEVQPHNVVKEGNEIAQRSVLLENSTSYQMKRCENVKVILEQEKGRNLKGCLKKCGYGFLKSNRPIVPSKSVRFNTHVNIKYFEVENGITKKTSAICQNNNRIKDPKDKILPNRNVIADICNWNAFWLEESRAALDTDLPPVFQNLKNVQKKFRNHEAYSDIFTTLLLLELWHKIRQKWKENSSGSYRFPAILQSYTKIQQGSAILTLIKCDSLLEFTAGVPIREGDLIMLQLSKASKTCENNDMSNKAKKLVFRIFGYITKRDALNVKPANVHPLLVQKSSIPEPDKILKLEILVTKPAEVFGNLSNYFQITGVHHITPLLVQCNAVNNLQASPLCQSILSPDRSHLTLSYSLSNEDLIFTGPLDDTQRGLILKLLWSCINRDHNLFVIQGGAGTGKTQLMMAFIIQLIYTAQWKRFSRPKILYCAQSNNVVDGMALKLKNYRHALNRETRFRVVRFGTLNSMKPNVRDISSFSLGVKNDIINRTKVLDEEIKILVAELENNKLGEVALEKSNKLHAFVKEREMLKTAKPLQFIGINPAYASECVILEKADIICTTTIFSGHRMLLDIFHRLKLNDPSQKIICIVDEAMHCKESETIVPVNLGVTDLILVGDARQLRAPVRNQMTQSLGLNQSLFWRISSLFQHFRPEISPIFSLKTQYRMNTAISAFPNKVLYKNSLVVGSVHKKNFEIDDYAVLIDTGPYESSDEDILNRLYKIALKLIIEIVNLISSVPECNFEVITCKNESEKLKDELKKKLDENLLCKVEVNPIENVQGEEFDIVLFIFEPNMTYLDRANVALTRAKHSLIILTSIPLDTNKFLSKLIEEAVIRGVSSYVNTNSEGQSLIKACQKSFAK